MTLTREELEHLAWSIELVEPKDHHNGKRIRIQGICVDENTNDAGRYVDVELPKPGAYMPRPHQHSIG